MVGMLRFTQHDRGSFVAVKQGGAGIGQDVLLGQSRILVDGLPCLRFEEGEVAHDGFRC